MKATAKQLQAMQEEIKMQAEDIQALHNGASLKAMGVPKGMTREQAIEGWAARLAAIQAKIDAGEVFPL